MSEAESGQPNAAGVATVTFAATRFRQGYDPDEVVALLSLASDTLASYERGATSRPRGAILSAEVRGARFTPTKFRRGWDQRQVDDYLDRVADALQQHESPA